MRDNIVQFLSILLLHFFSRGDAAALTSVCFTAARGYVNGPQDCTGGSIFLKGTFIEVGIHSAGSFGTANNAPSGFAYAGRALGFIADYDKNGFTGTYGFAGDYFVPGTPLEGWVVEWTSSGSTKRFVNEGLMRRQGIPTTTFSITSTDLTQSSLWVGQVSDVRVTAVTQFEDANVYFTTTVTLQNIGTAVITNMYYMRTVDPDQEQVWYGNFDTRNYVKFQRLNADGTATTIDYTSSTYPDSALVIGTGYRNFNTVSGVQNYNFVLGLGSINPNAQVNHGFFDYPYPSTLFTSSASVDMWKSFGGKDVEPSSTFISRMRLADEAIHLNFKYSSLAPGDFVQFSYAYILRSADLFTALVDLSVLSVTQPSSLLSGRSATISCVSTVALTSATFSVFGIRASISANPAWYTVGTTSTNTAVVGFIYSVIVDSSVFTDGNVQISVTGLTATRSYFASKAVSLSNSGISMQFTTSSPACTFGFPVATNTLLAVAKVTSTDPNPDGVAFYREYTTSAGDTTSKFISADTSSPYQVSVYVGDLATGISVTIKATTQSGTRYTTTTFCGVVGSYPNKAPTSLTLTGSSIAENSAIGTQVGVLSATDSDVLDTVFTYTIIDNAGGLFSISGNKLLVAGAINFEAAATRSIRVTVSDGNADNCCFSKDFVITIINVNEAPTSISPTSINMAENLAIGTVIGTLVTVDPDIGQTVTYSLLASSTTFSVDSVTGQIRNLESIDFETVKSFSLSVRASDNGSPSASLSTTITITVTDVNEAPYAMGIAYIYTAEATCNVRESALVGSTIATLSSSDYDASDTAIYSLVSSTSGLFDVNSVGQVFVKAGLDFETLTTITLVARVTDSKGLTFSKSFTVKVCDVFEGPIVSATMTCNVDENRAIGSTVLAAPATSFCQVVAASADGTDITFSIPDPTGVDFTIQSCSGIFYISQVPNFEVKRAYTFTVYATSGSGATSSTIVTINVIDVNESPVLSSTAAVAINENIAAGTTVISSLTSRVTDPDTSSSSSFCCTLTFSITGGNTNGMFSMSDATIGRIVTAKSPDFESVSSYSLSVTVTDKGGLTSTAVYVININNINEKPAYSFTTSGIFASVDENCAVGTTVGDGILAIDPDAGQSVVYSITAGNIGNAFGLVPKVVAGLTLQYITVVAVPDYETLSTYSLTISAVDNGSPQLSDSAVFRVQVNDLYDTPTFTSPLTFSINENSGIGTLVGDQLYNYYSDKSGTYSIAFSISSYGGDTVKSFSINSLTGQLTFSKGFLNFEAGLTYQYTVAARASNDVTVYSTVNIVINNVQEPPYFTSCGRDGYISENLNGVTQYVSNSDQAVIISAVDDDGDTLSFSVVSVNGDSSATARGYFTTESVTSTSFQVKSSTSFNYEVLGLYTVVYSVTDGTTTSTQTCTVNIVDANDTPNLPTSKDCFILETAKTGDTVCTIVGSDEDPFGGTSLWGDFTYLLTTTETALAIRTVDNIGTLYLTKSVKDAGWTSAANVTGITVTGQDGGALSDATSVKIVIVKVDFPPTCPSTVQSFTVAENAAVGVSVGVLVGSNAATQINDPDSTLQCRVTGGDTSAKFTIDSSNILRTNANDINFETKSSYALTVTCTAVGLIPVATSCAVNVAVTDVVEFSTISAQSFSVDENIVSGPITVSLIAQPAVAVTKGDSSTAGVFNMVCVGCTVNPFSISSSTGVISLKSGFSLNFEVLPNVYTYTVSYADARSTVSATVTITELDVNEIPIMSCATSFSVNETVEEGVPYSFGQVVVTDSDFENVIDFSKTSCKGSCGLTYSMTSDAGGIFAVDSTGLLSVSGIGVDYETSDAYTINVKVTDDSGLFSSCSFTVAIVDVPDCSVSSITDASFRTITTASTAGGARFFINGNNLGPTTSFLTSKSLTSSAVTVTGTLQTTSSAVTSAYMFSISCIVNSLYGNTNQQLNCTMPAGVGANLGTIVTIATKIGSTTKTCSTAFAGSISYEKPVISVVANANALATAGGTVVTLTGSNFGAAGVTYNFVKSRYSNSYFGRDVTCVVTTSHTTMTCSTTGCAGSGISWFTTVGGQISNTISGSSSCATPSITSITSTPLNTAGGVQFSLTGTNFGDTVSRIVVAYGLSAKYTASCSIVTAHTALRCTSSTGIGTNLGVAVKVADLTSVVSSQKLTYKNPVVDSLSGAGLLSPTSGDGLIFLTGTQFGPLTVSPSDIVVTYGKVGTEYTAVNCAVFAANTKLSCRTVEGTGTDLIWKVSIGGLVSNTVGFSAYQTPSVYYYSGDGIDSSTVGGEVIYLYGNNFGKLDASLESVTYREAAADVPVVFDATSSCSIYSPHETLVCTTVPGAGSNLVWSVTVDGQQSSSPTTTYEIPVISSITGPGSSNANTAGGEMVYISGSNFGPEDAFAEYGVNFLESVTYGASGTEYVAANCMVLNQSMVRCTTIAGVGGGLFWVITVRGQSSVTSSVTTSYATPYITSMAPTSGTTDGSVRMKLIGTNFATSTYPQVYFGGVAMTEIIYGSNFVQFYVPEKDTVDKTSYDVIVVVGGQSSNVKSFTFLTPVITSVNAFVDSGISYLNAVGSSFSKNPTVTAVSSDGTTDTLYCETKTHTEVVCEVYFKTGTVSVSTGVATSNSVAFEVGEPTILYSVLQSGTALTSGYSGSNNALIYFFGQNIGASTSAFVVYMENRETLDINNAEVVSFTYVSKEDSYARWITLSNMVSNEDPDFDFQEIVVKLPEGQGEKNSFKVNRGGSISYGCGCATCTSATCFTYLPPVITSITTPIGLYTCGTTVCNNRNDSLSYVTNSEGCDDNSPVAAVTCGVSTSFGTTNGNYSVTLRGSNFGVSPVVMVGGVEWIVDTIYSNHIEVNAFAPSGQGDYQQVYLNAGNQFNNASISGKVCYFSYQRPTVDVYISTLEFGTEGSITPVTVTGNNFGTSDQTPVVKLGHYLVDVTDFTHNSISFIIPPGQGTNLYLSVLVDGQIGYSTDTFTYSPPTLSAIVINATSSRYGLETSGGRKSNVTAILTGTNFGIETDEWEIYLGTNKVLKSDVISYSMTEIVLFPPPGSGSNLEVSVVIGCQSTTLAGMRFSYIAPIVFNMEYPEEVNTDGGDVITLTGVSFGGNVSKVYVYDVNGRLDPSYPTVPTDGPYSRVLADGDDVTDDTTDDNIDLRMPPTLVDILFADDYKIIFAMPPGAGSDLMVFLLVDDLFAGLNFSYSKPVAERYTTSRGSDASGGEELKIYGRNFGSITTPISIALNGIECLKPVKNLDDFGVFLRCTTPPLRVGVQDIVLNVGFSTNKADIPIEFQCKRGNFGGEGEFCTVCSTGYYCPNDNMYMPMSESGFYILYEKSPNSYCSEESQELREYCPASLPCVPTDACPGNNTCTAAYTSTRCQDCSEGYYRINGECQPCPDNPWLIVLFAFLVVCFCGYIGYKLASKNVNFGILAIGIDYLQVLAVFGSAQVSWPQSLTNLYNFLSIFNFNIDVAAPDCWNTGVSMSFRLKWIIITALPVGTVIFLFIVYYLFMFQAKLRGINKAGANYVYKLGALYLMMFYYGYLLLSNNTLAVFNCQPPEISDGNKYMVETGPAGGPCYEKGQLQQELAPWAILAFIFYIIGFPAFCGIVLYQNREKVMYAQVTKAAGIDDIANEKVQMARFKMIFNKLYYQFKPEYYYWVFCILARKGVLSVSAIIFRQNVIFLLALYLLTLFFAYTAQVAYKPFMSTSEYEDVVVNNSYLLNNSCMDIISRSERKVRNRAKVNRRLGAEGPLFEKLKPQVNFFNNYNTVEAYLLMSSIFICIAAIMFESEQLSGEQRASLAYIVILVVTVSLAYFGWVLFSELWIAFYPEIPLPWLGINVAKEDDLNTQELDENSFTLDNFEKTNPMRETENNSDKVMEEVAIRTQLNKATDQIQELQSEILRLKKQQKSANSIAFVPQTNEKKTKVKREFQRFDSGDDDML